MDIKEIRLMAIILRQELLNVGVRPALILLFGSRAHGKPSEDSDIDVAVVSGDYGNNRFEQGVQLNTIAHRINPLIEAIPVSSHNYLDVDCIVPIIDQIKKTGLPLL